MYFTPMRELFVDRYCGALLDTERTTPFGEDTVVWTVRGHMFAAYAVGGDGVSVRLAGKIAAQQMVGQGRAKSPPYLRGEGWVSFPWDTPLDELRGRINKSYRLVLKDGNAVH
ncbi:MmcQ/YjbR family DNA-binding protein [Gymnodinialimonas ulvae]|uniref:MmcQ/YjbR family DNA-binding protein n=1 Tax=Gymnodinialimonas ulvae TaxID=3126504 RepID=UPI0030EDAC70